MAACISAARGLGIRAENCGPLPTPALALRAMSLGAPAIMVTGSHIPADRNGLKFHRPDGEIGKADEAGILAFLDLEKASPFVQSDVAVASEALRGYIERCASLLAAGALAGKRIGVYQHSSVARDLMVDILRGVGRKRLASAVPISSFPSIQGRFAPRISPLLQKSAAN